VVAVERAPARELANDRLGAAVDLVGEEGEEPVAPRDRGGEVGMEQGPRRVRVHVRDVQVEVAVAVVIRPRNAHAGAAVDDARGRGALAEGTVALVVVERVAAELVRDVQVGPAVAVVVAPCAREVPARVTYPGAARG